MSIEKITKAPTNIEVVQKINELIDGSDVDGFGGYWEPNENVEVGDIRYIEGRDNVGLVLECVQAGTTGNSAPAFSDEDIELSTPEVSNLVTSVNGKTGDVVVDVGVTSVNNKTGAVTLKESPSDMNDYIVESYRNGASWYEVYKSGKVRQGGVLSSTSSSSLDETVTLMKPMADENYCVNSMVFRTSDSAFPSRGVAGYAKRYTTSVRFVFAYAGSSVEYNGFTWIVEGQGA